MAHINILVWDAKLKDVDIQGIFTIPMRHREWLELWLNRHNIVSLLQMSNSSCRRCHPSKDIRTIVNFGRWECIIERKHYALYYGDAGMTIQYQDKYNVFYDDETGEKIPYFYLNNLLCNRLIECFDIVIRKNTDLYRALIEYDELEQEEKEIDDVSLYCSCKCPSSIVKRICIPNNICLPSSDMPLRYMADNLQLNYQERQWIMFVSKT